MTRDAAIAISFMVGAGVLAVALYALFDWLLYRMRP